MINVNKIHVVHYAKLVERKANLDAFFRSIGFDNVEYETSFDRDSLSSDLVARFYNYSKDQYDRTIRKVYGPICVNQPKLRPGEIACSIAHCEVLRKISEGEDDYALILEDDVIPCEGFAATFNSFLARTPPDWDVIYLGDGAGLRVPKNQIVKDKIAYLKTHPASKCSDSFLIKKTLAKKIYRSIVPFSTVIDWEYSYHLYLHDARVYWWDPPVISQGSEKGKYGSSLR